MTHRYRRTCGTSRQIIAQEARMEELNSLRTLRSLSAAELEEEDRLIRRLYMREYRAELRKQEQAINARIEAASRSLKYPAATL